MSKRDLLKSLVGNLVPEDEIDILMKDFDIGIRFGYGPASLNDNTTSGIPIGLKVSPHSFSGGEVIDFDMKEVSDGVYIEYEVEILVTEVDPRTPIPGEGSNVTVEISAMLRPCEDKKYGHLPTFLLITFYNTFVTAVQLDETFEESWLQRLCGVRGHRPVADVFRVNLEAKYTYLSRGVGNIYRDTVDEAMLYPIGNLISQGDYEKL